MSSRDYKEQVVAAVPIESYIGRYVALKRAGKRLTGLCPFHNEKTPSFSVTPEKGLFYCFGCGKGGDLLRFVMDYEGQSFPEALETLGRFAGIPKPDNFGSRKNDARDKLLDLNERVLRSFSAYLRSPEGRGPAAYLKERGLSAETLERFVLGASPESWDWLRSKYSEHDSDLVQLGLLKAGKQADRPPYDFFRNRVIFPIRDVSGRTVAFGGRILPAGSGDPPQQAAKYINSPESPVFHKSKVLYGLFEGLAEIRAQGECFLVEGYMDVIGLHQAGVRTACAPLGTALTPDHLKLISRYADRLCSIFDGDRAGRSAALKFSRLSIELGGQVSTEASVLLLPAGLDPFDLARELPAPRLQELLAPELRIPAARYFLLELMFPGRFTETVAPEHPKPGDSGEAVQAGDAGAEPFALVYAAQARAYYAGELPRALPRGTEKRPGLDRLFEGLAEIERDSDRLLLVEEAAHLLALNPAEVRREWQQSRAARRLNSNQAARRFNSNSPRGTSSGDFGSRPAPARSAPGAMAPRSEAAPIARENPIADINESPPGSPVDGERVLANEPFDFELGPDEGAGMAVIQNEEFVPDMPGADEATNGGFARGKSGPPRSPGPQQGRPEVQRIAACEQALMIELFMAPGIFGHYQPRVAALEFHDEQAEFFWRYLETRYLTGNIWTTDDLSQFELPEETMQIFSARILQRAEEEGPPPVDPEEQAIADRLRVTVVEDLLVELQILELKKRIADISSRHVVADSVEQSGLIVERGRLQKELSALQHRRRSANQSVS